MAHDLFLPEGEDDDVSPVYISIVRLKPYPDTSGGIVPADQIPDVPTLHALYGGGYYEAYARDERRRIIARRKIGPLPGRPKPLALVAEEDDYDDRNAARAPAPPAPQSTAAPSSDLFAFLAAQQEQQKQFMAAMLERSEKTTALVFQALTETIRTKAEAPLAVAREVAGPNTMETFLQGVEFARGLLGERMEAETESDGVTETIDLVARGADAFAKIQALSASASTQNAPAPTAEPLPRSENG